MYSTAVSAVCHSTTCLPLTHFVQLVCYHHTHPHPRAYTLRHTDYETGVIARMYADGSQGSGYNAAVIARAGFRIAALAEDAAGELYIIKYGESAQIYALPNPPGTVGTTSSATGPAAPPVVAPPLVAPPVVAPVTDAAGGNAVAPVVPAAPVVTATGGSSGSVIPGSVSVPTDGGGANANTCCIYTVCITVKHVSEPARGSNTAASATCITATQTLADPVVNQGTDLRGLEATAGRGVANVDAGDSIVYTLNVATAGTYNVVYTLSGQSPSNGVDVKFSLFQGEQKHSM
eukprot:15739-Heterococcus_DN1.PRE.2